MTKANRVADKSLGLPGDTGPGTLGGMVPHRERFHPLFKRIRPENNAFKDAIFGHNSR